VVLSPYLPKINSEKVPFVAAHMSRGRQDSINFIKKEISPNLFGILTLRTRIPQAALIASGEPWKGGDHYGHTTSGNDKKPLNTL
jgi:hypothetical protein